jgi:hypothetical protein
VDPLTAECHGKSDRMVTALRLSADRQTTANRVFGQLNAFQARTHRGISPA